jgi:hypothetical protein
MCVSSFFSFEFIKFFLLVTCGTTVPRDHSPVVIRRLIDGFLKLFADCKVLRIVQPDGTNEPVVAPDVFCTSREVLRDFAKRLPRHVVANLLADGAALARPVDVVHILVILHEEVVLNDAEVLAEEVDGDLLAGGSRTKSVARKDAKAQSKFQKPQHPLAEEKDGGAGMVARFEMAPRLRLP